MKHILLYTFLLLNTLLTYAQKENNIWYLGIPNGLDFNNGTPQWIDMQANVLQGGASVSDSNGVLQFYTNGRVILGKDHSIMPNSVYIDAAHHILPHTQYITLVFTQMAIIQPNINQPEYYLFYKPSISKSHPQIPYRLYASHDSMYLLYSKIDMRLNNGNGDVVSGLNNRPVNTTTYEAKALTAIGGKCNSWLVTLDGQRNANNRYDWPMTVFSVLANGDIREHTHFNTGISTSNYLQKELSISPSGNMIIENIHKPNYTPHLSFVALSPASVAIPSVLDFDKNTGILSNPRKRGLSMRVFFSPKGSKLLSMAAQEDTTFNPIILQQFDTTFLGDNDAIAANTETLDISSLPELMLTGNDYRGVLSDYDMRTGPDGKTYIRFIINYYNKDIHQYREVNALYCLLALKDADQGLSLNNIEVIAAGEQLAPHNYNPGVDSFERGGKLLFQSFGQSYFGRDYSPFLNQDAVIHRPNAPDDTVQTITMCKGENVVLYPPYPDAPYTWWDGSTADSVIITAPGAYKITTTYPHCTFSQYIWVRLSEERLSLPIHDTTICSEQPLTVYVNRNNTAVPEWSNGTVGDSIVIDTAGTYTVKAQTNCGILSDSIVVHTKICSCNPRVPTAFSPNADGLNDVIHPVMNCEVTNYSFRIFDRYGKLVFEGKQPQDAWNGHTNGKTMDIGVYFWILQFKDQLGTEHLHKGDMTLLR